MSRDRNLTESMLYEALDRLLQGQPTRVKPKGKLTLNKVNNEAGLGNSYVHKFPDFVTHAKPIIDNYNNNRQKLLEEGLSVEEVVVSEIDQLKSEKLREQRLKEKYKQQRDDAITAKKDLEVINNTLMFRLYELQEELSSYKEHIVNIK
ncbi:hypothetical protein [Vibrio splendidus]|uniref:hypothetical protein n=1 Tax=Vibrio splendidus TaxID=29497 RepID=UPI00080E07E0|nr:hypothetical protein [Vibrio splendidus]OCH68730.1 hypothetical protein A6D94_04925 [Vibrio splendidus]